MVDLARILADDARLGQKNTITRRCATVVGIARERSRRTGQILCPFMSLLAPLRLGETTQRIDDPLAPEQFIRGAPGWAFDMFVREGRHAFEAERFPFARNSARSICSAFCARGGIDGPHRL